MEEQALAGLAAEATLGDHESGRHIRTGLLRLQDRIRRTSQAGPTAH